MEPESDRCLLKDGPTTKFFLSKKLLYAAGAGLSAGILLTVAVIYLFSSGSQSSSSDAACLSNARTQCTHGLCISSQHNTSIKKSFMIFTEEKKNWYEAMAACHEGGMLFAAIESEEEFQGVLRLINAKNEESGEVEDFWVSGSDLGHNGTFVWMSTGRKVTFNRWFYDEENLMQEPTNGAFCGEELEHCVELMHAYHYEMNDNCCHHRKSYICESLNCPT